MICVLGMMAVWSCAQYGWHPRFSVLELLQYQQRKGLSAHVQPPFGKYGGSRIRASSLLPGNDPRQLWGREVGRNDAFVPDKQPLYRIFRKKSDDSVAFIDTWGGSLQVVFWNKLIYRHCASELRRMGFVCLSNAQSNVLAFRKDDVSLKVDVIVWSDMYVMEIYT